jgi:cell division transport system permease protein
MTFDPRTAEGEIARPGALFPRQSQQDGTLGLIVAVLCFLACLCAVAGSAADRAASGWRRELGASATVQVRPKAGETPSEAAARAAEALAGAKGVSEARALDREAVEKLLEPWLGKGNIPDDLPLPRLVVVELNHEHPADAATLNQALATAGVDGAVDDHARWIEDVRRTGDIARGGAFGALLLFALVSGAVIAFATRATLQSRRDVVEVLHLAGAEDRFVAGLVQRRFAWLAGEAGAIGAALAAAVGAGVKFFGGPNGLTPVLPLEWTDLLVVLPCPLLAAGVAAIAVRRTAMSILRSAR